MQYQNVFISIYEFEQFIGFLIFVYRRMDRNRRPSEVFVGTGIYGSTRRNEMTNEYYDVKYE